MEGLEKEFQQPNVILPNGQDTRHMFGARIIIIDTDILGLCTPFTVMYKIFGTGGGIAGNQELDDCKRDFLGKAILRAKEEIDDK